MCSGPQPRTLLRYYQAKETREGERVSYVRAQVQHEPQTYSVESLWKQEWKHTALRFKQSVQGQVNSGVLGDCVARPEKTYLFFNSMTYLPLETLDKPGSEKGFVFIGVDVAGPFSLLEQK